MVVLATMALMLSATGASAEPHTTDGEPLGSCLVNGEVELTDPDSTEGLENTRSNNSYEFRQTTLECTSTDEKVDGNYQVIALGETAGFNHKDPGDDTKKELQFNGEDCDQGGSRKIDSDGDGSLDEVHSGDLDADEITPPDDATNNLDGKVHFIRLGTTVLADGPLWEEGLGNPLPDNNPKYWFQAELEFIPLDGDCAADPVGVAALTGTAEIYAGSADHNCGNDSSKFDDKDC